MSMNSGVKLLMIVFTNILIRSLELNEEVEERPAQVAKDNNILAAKIVLCPSVCYLAEHC